MTKYFFDTGKARNVVTSVEGVCSCGGGGSQLTSWAYDNNLNVTSSTDALSRVTSYTYDAAGNMLTVTDPTGTVTYTYNSFGQVLTRTDQMTGVTTNTYDPTGNSATSRDPLGNTTTFALRLAWAVAYYHRCTEQSNNVHLGHERPLNRT